MPKTASKKPVIAIDVDDVLAPHFELMKEHFKQAHGIEITHVEMQHGALSRVEPSKHETIIDSAEQFIASPAFYVDPLPGAIEAIQALKQHYKLIIITARPLSIERLTIDWVRSHFSDTFDHISVVGAPRWGKGATASKDHLFQMYDVSYLIEDRLSHCKKAAEVGVQALLFGAYKWNETNEELPAGMTRVKDWQAVTNYFNDRHGR